MFNKAELMRKVVMYNLYKKIGRPRVLPMVFTIIATDYCNSRCRTCNVWRNDREVKLKEQFTPEEYGKTFKNYGNLFWISVTGGEPFLRDDLGEVMKIVYDNTKPQIVSIATNGLLTSKIVKTTNDILETCPDMKLSINLSLEGIGEKHDEIMGIKGNFKIATKTLTELKGIENENLTVGVNTVMSKLNIGNFIETYDYIMNNLKPDSFITEVAETRDSLFNQGIYSNIVPDKEQSTQVLRELIQKMREERRESGIAEIVRKLRLKYYEYVIQNKIPKTNFDGIAIACITPNGELCLSYSNKISIGSLRDADYDFKKLWFSEKARKLRQEMDRQIVINKAYDSFCVLVYYVNFLCNLGEAFSLLR
jgi:MoaA/NifB/PqqE/SkfB family radical SAM enzyme